MTISGGMPTIFVSDMGAAVRFYIEALGLKLLERYGDHWASIDCGHGLTIGLHPASAQNPAGRVGSMTIGFRSSDRLASAYGLAVGRVADATITRGLYP